jgi:hypothetical protein
VCGGLKEGRRLGCQAQVLGDVVLDVPPESQVHRQVVRKEASQVEVVMHPAAHLHYVEVTEPDMHEPRATSSGWRGAAGAVGRETVEAPLPCCALQPALRKGEWQVTVAPLARDEGRRGLDLWPGFHEGRILALTGCGLDHHRRRTLTDCGKPGPSRPGRGDNPQIRFGEDLMTPGVLRDDEPGRRPGDDGAVRAGDRRTGRGR